jgi:hypothetical protein
MENRLNKKIENYIIQFKDDVRQKITEIKSTISDKNIDKLNDLVQFVYDYERLILNADDFDKRKRVKNSIPNLNRCSAKRANGEQCTRRRKDNCEFCGTHDKGAPHGLVEDNTQLNHKKTIEITGVDIQGIIYHIDKNNNVYNTEDILNNKENPEIIAKYNVSMDNVYSIVSFAR